LSAFHRSIRMLGTTALAIAPVAVPAAAPMAMAAPLLQAPMHSAGGAHPLFLHTHGRNADTSSTNWAGYAANGSTYTSVSTTFTQPSVDCSQGDGYSSFWVGLDGYSSSTVEQTGTEADCSGGVASYSAWYEMYPAYPVTYSSTVEPGDTITATVTYSGSNKFVLKLSDSTRGWSHSTTKTLRNAARSSAEIIAEAPSDSSGPLPLDDFGKATFKSVAVNGSSLGSTASDSIDMVDSAGTTQASTSSLSGGNSFSVTWESLN
jgi:peptidase A4-like protein